MRRRRRIIRIIRRRVIRNSNENNMPAPPAADINIREYNPMKRIWELKTRTLSQPFVRYACVIRQNAQKDGRQVVM